MTFNRGIIFYIFTAVVCSSIHCVLGLYEAIYYFDLPDRFFAFQEVTYNPANEHYVLKTPYKNKNIHVACPRQGQFNLSMLEIDNTVFTEATVTPKCELPAQPRIYLSKNPKVYDAVGFMVYRPYLQWDNDFFYSEPKYHMVIGVIYFKFDHIMKRIAFLRYNIVGGKFLNLEPSRDFKSFIKNQDMLDYDIDSLYTRSGCPFVKVPLAPVDDFLFDSWKSAARQNVLTAPMIPDALSQWQALEIFIRKISQVIDALTVTTGVFGHLIKSPNKNESLSNYVHSQNSKLRAPEYFWKAITLQFSRNSQKYEYGILFIMQNSQLRESDVEKFCSEYDIASKGWTFLKDDLIKGPMYGCPLDNDILEFLGGKIDGQFKEFDLNSLSLLKLDEEGNSTVIENVNVVEEMKGQKGAEKDDVQV